MACPLLCNQDIAYPKRRRHSREGFGGGLDMFHPFHNHPAHHPRDPVQEMHRHLVQALTIATLVLAVNVALVFMAH